MSETTFRSHHAIRTSPVLKNIDKPTVWVFPELVVYLDCGPAEFVVPDAELRLLAKRGAAAAG